MQSFMDRVMLLPSALLALTLSCALAADASNSINAAPISISPSEQWDGIDGSWSSFNVKLGTPAQEIRTFVSWNAYQTWAVIPQGCEPASDYDACAQSRGGIWNSTASNSYEEKGLYSLYVLQNLGYDGNGYYGFDVEELGDDGPTLRNTTIAGFAAEDFYLGVLGLNPKPTNFTNTVASSSYMSQMKEKDRIPSISFGYTAGAQYRENTTSMPYGSLTLGGYDETKFYANDIEWNFAADNSRDIVVVLQSVNTPSQVESSPVATELLPDDIYIYLDATVPHIWLPIESCYVFEYEFGLTYDNTSDLYLVNNTLHQQLLNKNASITFQLGTELGGGNVVDIELPYAAFDLTVQIPYAGVNETSYYFPLRRAMNSSQYTLGRTFFQEAYIAVDYESQKFNVSQRSWADSSNQHIVAIPAYTEATSTYPGVGEMTTSSSNSLSGGAIAGIVVGVVALLAIVICLLLWLRRRSKAKKQRIVDENEKLTNVSEHGSEDHHPDTNSSSGRGAESIVIPKAELPGSQPLSHQDSDDNAYLASGALSSYGGMSATGSSSPSDVRTPRNALSGATFVHGRWNGEPYSPASDTPEEGTQTHSSTQSSHGTGSNSNSNYGTNTGTLMSIVSPLSDSSAEADGIQLNPVSELQGDEPPVREKDGKAMTEKEVQAYREKKYNGVSTPPVSPIGPSTSGPPRTMVNPEDVVRVGRSDAGAPTPGGLHRQFSFEHVRGGSEEGTPEEDLYKG